MDKQEIHILLYYKFVELSENDVDWFVRTHLNFCEELGIKGRILVACEGINGSVSGSAEQMEVYKKGLTSDSRFSDLRFKEEIGLVHPFNKMKVLKREEIVSLKRKVDFSYKTDYVTADELFDWYENREDFVVFDTRNDYEFNLGHFKNSIQVETKTFREFPDAVEKFADLKEKKIVIFCTGGIRCEKAGPLMKELGFKNVYQLKDGIVTFLQKYPNTYWEGRLFVFDKRMVSDLNKESNAITVCEVCGVECDLYKNCRNYSCDRFVVECLDCQEKLLGCCSEKCCEELNEYFREKSLRNQGRKISA